MSEAYQIGKQLVELCREGKWMDAIDKLYSKDIVSIEAGGPPDRIRMQGFDAVKGKSEWWEQNHDVHKAEVQGPWPHGDRFIVRFTLDVTAKGGPMAGQRMTLDEVGLYTVKNGKIAQEEFFYHMGG